MSTGDQRYSYPPSDPYAERPTEVYPAGVYRSAEAYPPAPAPAHAELPANSYPPPAPPAPGSAERQAMAIGQAEELSHQALRRLRARLVRKYH